MSTFKMADTKSNKPSGVAIFKQFVLVGGLTADEISDLKPEIGGHIKDMFGADGAQNEQDVNRYKLVLKLCIEKQILSRNITNENVHSISH